MICCARKDNNENPTSHSLKKVGTGMLTYTDPQPSNRDKEVMDIEMNTIRLKAAKVGENQKVEVNQEVPEIEKPQKNLVVIGGEDEKQQVKQDHTYGAGRVIGSEMNANRPKTAKIMSEEARVLDYESSATGPKAGKLFSE